MKKLILFFALTLSALAGIVEPAQSQIRIPTQNLKESDLSVPGALELGDGDYILNPSVTPEYIYLTQPLTQDRIVTLTAGAVTKRKTYWFIRNTQQDGFDWIIQGLDTLQLQGEKTKIHYDGSEWRAISFTEPQEPEFLGANPGVLELGDADYSFDVDVTPEFVFLTEPLTQDRTVTLSTVGMTPSKKYWFIRKSDAEGFNWIIGGIGLLAEKDQKILVIYDGTDFRGIFFPAQELEVDVNLVNVDPGGGADNPGCGAVGNECASIAYAGTQASPGQIIQLAPGIYNETAEIVLPLGVSVRGTGIGQSIINSSQTNVFNLISSAPVKSGNHKISKLTINGNGRTATVGIHAEYRSGIEIDSVEIKECDRSAILIKVSDATKTLAPANYLTGIKITNNVLTNTSMDDSEFSTGAIAISGLSGAVVTGNVINENEGYGIKFENFGWYINSTFSNNTITVPDSDPLWVQDIGIELWNLRGGNVISYNTLNTWMSLVRGNKGSEAWAVKVFENTITQNPSTDDKVAIEIILSDVEVYDNRVDGYGSFGAIAAWSGTESGNISNIDVYRNICTTTQTDAPGFLMWGLAGGTIISDIRFFNNTIETSTWGMQLRSFNNNPLTVNDLVVTNNAFLGDGGGSDSGLRYVGDDSGPDILTVNNAIITHNIFYAYGAGYETSNNASNVDKNNHTLNSNLTSDPNLDGNFTPQGGSDAIDGGTNMGLPYNGSAPDIGAVETE